MDYIGHFKIINNTYEVFNDKPRDIINIFYRNTNQNDVECWSFKRSNIDKEKGNNLINKTKNHLIKVLQTNNKMLDILDIKPFLQTFPMSFWYDFVIPIKKGEETNFKIETISLGEKEYNN